MRQKLGQHFLKNRGAANRMIRALEVQAEETVIEIGPGRGALTEELAKEVLKKKGELILIERDPGLARDLEGRFEEAELLVGDALEEIPKATAALKDYKIVGNIPYYISGHLFRVLSLLPNKPKRTILMIQKEVAERVVCRPPKMNRLSAITAAWGVSSILFNLGKEDFAPPPEVLSSVLEIDLDEKLKASEEEGLYELIHILFQQPRKTALNNLVAGTEMGKEKAAKILGQIKESTSVRPQDLSIEDLIKIYRSVKN